MNKKPLHEDFLSSKDSFRSTQNFWKKLISKNNFVENANDNVMFHTDGNPIYYSHFPNLGKSIRIIQEPFDSTLSPHFGAWIEPANDYRTFDELVISIELTNLTYKPVKKLIYMWLSPELSNRISEEFLESYIQRSIANHGLDF